MNKAERKFRLYAILVLFVLLTVMLAVINGINFTMAARDADLITEKIAALQGTFDGIHSQTPGLFPPGTGEFRMGPMGPDSPEVNSAVRYFTIAFSNKGKTVETVAYRISAVTESEAREWAAGLIKEKTGWTRGTYRYRVYKIGDTRYVTVIDQGSELLPSFRILIISAVGEVICLVIGWFLLLLIGRSIYKPLEEADRKQKNFIRNADREFRVPLTIISGNTELAERKNGPDDGTRSTRRQIGKLNALLDRLGSIGIFEDDDMNPSSLPLSEYLKASLDRSREDFAARGIGLETDIEPDVTVVADPEGVRKMIDELVGNALKYSLTKASFRLRNENGHILLESANDARLPDGPVDQVFDRFTVLENAVDKEGGAGLGLAYVKDMVKAHKGRVTASVEGGTFTLRITL